jgi:hypothetical protein
VIFQGASIPDRKFTFVVLSVVVGLAMASLDTFQEQFSRLKELEGNKDHLIEVSCLDGIVFSWTILTRHRSSVGPDYSS